MPKVSSNRIVEFPVDKIYAAVMDIEFYPQVLSFVRNIRILQRQEHYLIARVNVGLSMLSFSYDCRIDYEKDASIRVQLISGPFKHMDAVWIFERLDAGRTKVIYSLNTEFKNPLMELTAGALFASQINQSIHAFEARLKRS